MNVVSVVLSDTHLGSAHSVLDPDAAARSGQTYPDHLESVLFAPLKRALPNGKAKFLVLNGDTIDFSLQTFQQALLRAAGFMQKIVASQIFEEIIYIPGNHDHNVWQLLQHEVTVTRRVAAGLPPKPYPYVQAGLLDLTQSTLSLPNVGSPYGDVFLKGLFHLGAPAGPDADELPIAVVYPNLFMFTQGSPDRPILATHGHLFCLPWILLTEVFPRALGLGNGLSLVNLERINSPFTELGWAALGQAGPLTKAAKQVYHEGGQGHANKLREVLGELAKYIDDRVYRHGPWDPREWGTDAGIKAFQALLLLLVKKAVDGSGAHRGSDLFLDDPETVRLVNKYLGLARSQYADLLGGGNAGMPSALIFGHTHVPIRPDHAGSVPAQRFGATYAVRAYNSGGWMQESGEESAHAIALTVDEAGGVGCVSLL